MRIKLDWKPRRIASGYRQKDATAQIGVTCTRHLVLERGEAEPKQWEIETVEKLLPQVAESVLVLE
jgi:hypothetical protein